MQRLLDAVEEYLLAEFVHIEVFHSSDFRLREPLDLVHTPADPGITTEGGTRLCLAPAQPGSRQTVFARLSTMPGV